MNGTDSLLGIIIRQLSSSFLSDVLLWRVTDATLQFPMFPIFLASPRFSLILSINWKTNHFIEFSFNHLYVNNIYNNSAHGSSPIIWQITKQKADAIEMLVLGPLGSSWSSSLIKFTTPKRFSELVIESSPFLVIDSFLSVSVWRYEYYRVELGWFSCLVIEDEKIRCLVYSALEFLRVFTVWWPKIQVTLLSDDISNLNHEFVWFEIYPCKQRTSFGCTQYLLHVMTIQLCQHYSWLTLIIFADINQSSYSSIGLLVLRAKVNSTFSFFQYFHIWTPADQREKAVLNDKCFR